MVHEEDIKLVRKLLGRDERAFEEFFHAYFPRLYRFALTRVKDDEEVLKDLLQATMASAIRALRSYRGEASLFTWMCQICRNEINSHYRKLKREPVAGIDTQTEIEEVLAMLTAPSAEEPHAVAARSEVTALVQAALDHLPVNYARALEWKYLEGFSVNEIAEKLEIGPVAAQSVLARAREAFREAVASASALRQLNQTSTQG